MRMRVLTILLIAVAITAVGIATGVPKNGAMAHQPTETARIPKSSISPARQQPTGFIDGSVNPELVPDQVAYSLLFRLLSDRHTKEEQNRVRSYLKMTFGCSNCNQAELKKRGVSEDAHINAFLVVVNEFEQRVGALDRKAQDLHDRYWPNPSHEVLAQLNEMQKQKEGIVAELVASLPTRLGAAGMEKLRQHINERVKRKVKMTSDHIHS